MEPRGLKILLADDHDVVRAGLRAAFETHHNWYVCGEATSGKEAVRLSAELRPDIVVLDLEMGDLDGVSAVRQIKQELPAVEVLIFTMHDDEYLIREVLSTGAQAFVLKSEGVRRLISGIECAIEHKPFLGLRASEALLKNLRTSGHQPKSRSDLTDRERQIVQLLARGRSNKEVALELGISVKTIETHRAAIMRKLGFNTTAKLVRYALREHLIRP